MKTRTLKSAWQRLSMSLALVMLTATAAWAQSAIGSIQYNSTGGYYEIDTTDNLNDLAVYVNGSGTYSTGVDETTGHDCKDLIFKVIGDINFSNGTGWNDDTSTEKNYTPIGAGIGNAKEFKGEFDGQGYTIRGIRMYKNGQYDYGYLGIFGKTGNSANIHDIRLADTRITGKSCIGGIVGYNAGTITNCHVAADVAIHVTQNDVSCHGGIVGLNSSGAISKCISSVTLTMAHNLTGCRTFGGIVGSLSGGTVSSSFAIGAAIPAVNGYGAICGRKDGGDTEYNYYYDCTVDGTAVTSGVGVGRLDDSSFDSTYHDGAVPMSGIAPGAWSETEPNVFTIHSADGWDVFCNIIAGGYNLSKKTVKLGTDITVTRMAGVDYKDFCGTFDGNGKTLTLDYTSTINCTAPFCQVKDGCVIENLHVDGTIASTQQYTAGIIGAQYGNVTIRNCRSSVNIQSTMSEHWYVQGNGKHGGFVGKVNNNTTTNLTIEGCVFDGKIVSNGETPTTHCSGFVGEKGSNASITITNSLYTPQADANAVSSGATFVEYWDGTPTNSYYTKTLGEDQEAQGKQACTAVAYPLNNVRETYNVSGITAYDWGLKREGTYYYGGGDKVSVNYVDEQGVLHDGQNGNSLAMATVLGGGSSETLNAATDDWYFVGSDITYTGKVTLNNDAIIILGDDCTMNIGTSSDRISDRCIDGKVTDTSSLTIYGQSGQSGSLNAYNKAASYTVLVKNYAQYGGNVTIDASEYHALHPQNGTFSRGTLTANATDNYAGIEAGTITLGWTNPDDRITASSYVGTVNIANGQSFINNASTPKIVSGTNIDKALVNGQTLQPIEAVTLAKEGYGTFYESRSNVKLPAGVKANVVTNYAGLTLNYETIADGDDTSNNVVPKGTAVMLQGPVTNDYTEYLLTPVNTDATPVTSNMLDGSDTQCTTIGYGKHYMLSYDKSGENVGWYWGADSGAPFQSAAHKAWLVLPYTAAPSFLGLPGDDEATSLSEELRVKREKLATATEWYTLDGRKLSDKPTTKGIYIVNGKKIVVK